MEASAADELGGLPSPSFSPFVAWKFVPSTFYWIIGLMFLACNASYLICHTLFPKIAFFSDFSRMERVDFSSRVASTLHSIIVFPLVSYVILTDYFGSQELYNNPVNGESMLLRMAMSFGIGYFLSDTMLTVRHQLPPVIPMVLHHLFAGVGFFIVIATSKYIWYSAFLYSSEGCNPFYNLWWLTCQKPPQKKWICTLFGWCFTISWFLLRVLAHFVIFQRLHAHWDEVSSEPFYLFGLLMLNVGFLFMFNLYFFIFGPFRDIVFGHPEEGLHIGGPLFVSSPLFEAHPKHTKAD